MKNSVQPKATARDRIVHELREFAVVALYLYLCFTAVAYLKATILHAHGIVFAPFGFAAIKALICAKFILVGRAFHVGERFKTLPLMWPILYKSIAFLVLLIVLNVIEEAVVGLLHHRTITESIAEIGGGTLDQTFATSIIMLLILVPFFAFYALGEILGDRNLAQLFFTHRHRHQS